MAEANKTTLNRSDADPEQIEIPLLGGIDVNFNEAVEKLFIDDIYAHLLIDVKVHSRREGWFWVRPSDHRPVTYDKVVNADSFGPFKVIYPL